MIMTNWNFCVTTVILQSNLSVDGFCNTTVITITKR